jgi:nitroimidazol reductase NimA-like FMN-containing flavoprotein (pyridoxamine 5'-phosphate oxidase superfamily)
MLKFSDSARISIPVGWNVGKFCSSWNLGIITGGYEMANRPGYPQMPPFNQQEAEIFLKNQHVARIGTLNDDGTVHLAPIYYKYQDGEFMLATQVASRKIRNIQRNPKVTLLVDVLTTPYQSVTAYGIASLDFENVVQKRTSIFEQFGTPEEAAKGAQYYCDKWPSLIIHIKPYRLVTVDYAKAN